MRSVLVAYHQVYFLPLTNVSHLHSTNLDEEVGMTPARQAEDSSMCERPKEHEKGNDAQA